MRYPGSDNTKKLRGFISTVVPLKNMTGFSDFFKKACFENIVKLFSIVIVITWVMKMIMII